MQRFRLMFVVLPALLATEYASAQPADEESLEFEQPLPAPEAQQPWQEGSQPLPGEALATDVPGSDDPLVQTPYVKPLHEFLGYRYRESSTGWIVGGGDQFGMFSLESNHYQPSGVSTGLGVGLKFHFLDGPQRTDMPPRVFDFSIGCQRRDQLSWFSYDVAVSVMASSDFEGSSREGIRFPSHAVAFLDVDPMTDLVLGVEYLDRGDIRLLPVAGLIVLPHPDVRLEAVFPRPRMVFRLTDTHRLFAAGELGGGTWAIERDALLDDLATYRDLRVSIGLECTQDGGHWSALEIGYLFDRRLEYTSGNGDYGPNDTVMVRLITTF